MRAMNREPCLAWLRRTAVVALCVVIVAATWAISRTQLGNSRNDLLTGRWQVIRQGETAPIGDLEVSPGGQVTCYDLNGARNMAPGYSERWEVNGNLLVATSTFPGPAGGKTKLLSRVKDSASRLFFPAEQAREDTTQRYVVTVKSENVLQLDLINSPTPISCTLRRVTAGKD